MWVCKVGLLVLFSVPRPSPVTVSGFLVLFGLLFYLYIREDYTVIESRKGTRERESKG